MLGVFVLQSAINELIAKANNHDYVDRIVACVIPERLKRGRCVAEFHGHYYTFIMAVFFV